ncbi:MAG: helix-turn-helix domain-containing protein [Alphaproteobacteria bacterium]|nr:helix-turn-helix domain-containing protein [Alphaproteobacteria bacterium]MCL2505581.1 helix-turn-helix domain-containing protein [Alphaproteobacteria bacterium]
MSINTKKNMGLRIKAIRSARKMTQEQLAEKVGISTEAISNIERGVNFPSFDNLIIIANVLNCQISDIVDNPSKGKKHKRIAAEAEIIGIIKALPDDKVNMAEKLVAALV